MGLDRLLEVQVALRIVERESSLGNRRREPAGLAKLMLPLGGADVVHRRAARHVEAAGETADFGVDRLASLLNGQGEALVTVHDEVGVVDLVDEDGRIGRIRLRVLDLGEDLPEPIGAWAEASVELVRATHGADDLGNRDLLRADVASRSEVQSPPNLLEIEKDPAIGPPPSTHAHHLTERGD